LILPWEGGHILVYAFDVLMQIYTSVGYSERDAAELILKNNLYGLDIDDRAYQLTYFAVMMKGRSYNRTILTKSIDPQICSMQESGGITDELINFVAKNHFDIKNDLYYLRDLFINAKEYGSILNWEDNLDLTNLERRLKNINKTKQATIGSISFQEEVFKVIKPLLKQYKILTMKYETVVTNPPYMGKNSMSKNLSDYIKINYPKTKSDLSTVFMERTFNYCKYGGYIGMINIHAWMFLSSYKELREFIINSQTLINMLHFGRGIFGGNFGTASFILSNQHITNYNATYRQLYEKPWAVDSLKQKRAYFFENRADKFILKQENFSKIYGKPFAYWISSNVFNIFNNSPPLKIFSEPKQGLATTDNNRFVRYWYEIDFNNIGFHHDAFSAKSSLTKWFPFNKGGKYRKWYGNNLFVINYQNDGIEIKENVLKKYPYLKTPDFVVKNQDFYFKEGGTWSAISVDMSVRYFEKGFIISNAGMAVYNENYGKLLYTIGFLNSSVNTEILLKSINATINFNAGDISNIPMIYEDNNDITRIVQSNINIVLNDWNNFETSWDFRSHPLLSFKEVLIENSFDNWDQHTQKLFFELKSNEEKLNEIFIDIYGLKSELDPKVDESQITLMRADLKNDIRSFISYAVGCMLGRYSLDEECLAYAGGHWDPSKYSKFLPDEDNIIPILDTEYFEDDIVGRFVEFVKVTFGEETLEENLDFIAQALKKKGNTSRKVIRNYFLTDYYKDHVKTYKKHPIYWLFNSGRNNGFKALIYMHRYEPDLVARVRTDYLHKTQKALETAVAHNDRIIETSFSASEKSKAVKAKNKLVKQLEETRKYDEALAHVANQK
jgi:Eco57I restriction endonuclease.